MTVYELWLKLGDGMRDGQLLASSPVVIAVTRPEDDVRLVDVTRVEVVQQEVRLHPWVPPGRG